MRYALVCAVSMLLASASAHAAPTKRAASVETTQRVHVVSQGQTLGKIARRYGLTVQELCAANRIAQTARIKPKQKLVIPGPDAADASQAAVEAGAKAAKTSPTKPSEPAVEGRRRNASKEVSVSKSQRATKQEKVEKKADFARRPKRRGYVTLFGPMGRWQGQVLLADGQVTAAARRGFMKILASWRSGDSEKIHGELIRLVTRVSDHFGGRPIRVVSGYRPPNPSQYAPHSRHNEGRAIDFSIPGVPNAVVRDFCRSLGNVGVGYYPNSSFVHLDVREIPTYWVDYAGPGQAPRYAHARHSKPASFSAVGVGVAAEPSGVASGSDSTQDEPPTNQADLTDQ